AMRLWQKRAAASDFDQGERWLQHLGQSEQARAFWYRFAQQTLGVELMHASAKMLEAALVDALEHGAPQTVTLPADAITQAHEFVVARGGKVRLGTGVQKIVVRQRALSAVELADGEQIGADAAIACIGPTDLVQLVPA